jgi:broad specificity phosphatase PhoE
LAQPRLWLIRHAQSVWNASGRWQGQADPPLSAHGRQQAELLAARLADLNPTAVYSSDLRRCIDTAAPLAAATGLVPQIRAVLREIDIGRWSGLTSQEIQQAFPEEWARMHAGRDVRRGGGETTAELAARVRAFTVELTQTDHAAVAVFTHGGWIRQALTIYLGALPANYAGVGNTSVTELLPTPTGYHLTTLGDRAHLDVEREPLPTTPSTPTTLRPAPASGYTPEV